MAARQNRKKLMLLAPMLGSLIWVGGGGVGLILIIVLIVVLLR
jgi:hypothetical protein